MILEKQFFLFYCFFFRKTNFIDKKLERKFQFFFLGEFFIGKLIEFGKVGNQLEINLSLTWSFSFVFFTVEKFIEFSSFFIQQGGNLLNWLINLSVSPFFLRIHEIEKQWSIIYNRRELPIIDSQAIVMMMQIITKKRTNMEIYWVIIPQICCGF